MISTLSFQIFVIVHYCYYVVVGIFLMMIDEKEKKVFCKFVPIIMERSVEFFKVEEIEISHL